MLEQINKVHQFMKKNQIQSFLIIVVLVLIGYYTYTNFFRKEHYDMKDVGVGVIIGYSSLCIICTIIPWIILYFIVKYASKNAIRETSRTSQNKS